MTDTPTTHKEMTLPESVTLYKVDIPNVGTMLTFAEPINPDCTFIMGEYTRHPKPMVQAEGGDFKTLWDNRPWYLEEPSDKEYAKHWYELGQQAALKNPSDAGGAKAKLEITRALNDARRCTNNVVSQGPMGSVTFEQGCAARDYIDRALVILESSKPAPPQADTPIKGAGEKFCKNHPSIPMRENLDGDDLCQACCNEWVRQEVIRND